MKKLLLLSCCIGLFMKGYSQNIPKEYRIRTVAFYNLENLFDTIDDPAINDEASPMMKLKRDAYSVYLDKIDKLSYVISQIGVEKAKTSPVLIGVCEIENKRVLEDLVNTKHLKDKKYQIIHYDSPSLRGIDVALLYQEKYFKPIYHEAFNPNIYKNGRKIFTRDQLLVAGYLDDELIYLIVNHWPSRRGGAARSRPLREKAAYQNIKIIEQIRKKNADPKIFLLGDFNDSPTDDSFKKILKSKGEKRKLTQNDLFNPYEKLHGKGYNTLGYRDNVYLFDQILVSASLVYRTGKDFSSYKLFSAHIFNKPFLITKKGRYKGYPFRSFSYGNYIGGYSDHFPVYVHLIKEKK